MSFVKCTALIFVLVLSGCATFRDGANPPITKWPPDSALKNKTIAIQVIGKSILNNQTADVNVEFLENWREQVVRAYETSGFFSAVKNSSDQCDIFAEVSITDKGEASGGLAFLTGFSMFIIPAHAREGFIVKTTYKDKSGNAMGSFEKAESADTWIQLFLLPMMPFKPLSEYKEMLFDLNRNTLIEAHEKKLF